MAVPAIDPHAADVMCVAELNRLLHEVVLPGVPARQVKERHDAAERQSEGQDRKKAEPRIDVGVPVKNLAHRASTPRCNLLGASGGTHLPSLSESVDVRSTLPARAFHNRATLNSVKLFTSCQ